MTSKPNRRPQLGDCLYFKEAKTGIKKSDTTLKFNGHAFAMWLGTVPHFAKEPEDMQLFPMMGALGWLTFDDVAEFLGEEAGRKCVEAYTKKYSAVAPPTIEGEKIAGDIASEVLQKAEESARTQPSKLLDAHGHLILPEEKKPDVET